MRFIASTEQKDAHKKRSEEHTNLGERSFSGSNFVGGNGRHECNRRKGNDETDGQSSRRIFVIAILERLQIRPAKYQNSLQNKSDRKPQQSIQLHTRNYKIKKNRQENITVIIKGTPYFQIALQ